MGKGSEAEFWDLLRHRTGLKGGDAALRQYVLPRFGIRPGMVVLVDARQHYMGHRCASDWLRSYRSRGDVGVG